MEKWQDAVIQIKCASVQGTGFYINSRNGYLVTNQHVVESAIDDPSVPIEIIGARGVRTRAELIWASPFVLAIVGEGDNSLPLPTAVKDLAILRTTPVPLPDLPLGSGALAKVNDSVLALGFPGMAGIFASEGIASSVTRGIVSSITTWKPTGARVIMTDATINDGNSGGPLILENLGCVIGINFAGLSGLGNPGNNFAVLADELKDELDRRKIPYASYSSSVRFWIVLVLISLFTVSLSIIGISVVMFRQMKGKKYKQGEEKNIGDRPIPKGTPVLVGTRGEYYGARIPIDATLCLGRDHARCNLVIDSTNTKIGRIHVEVGYDANSGTFWIKDKDSKSGTYVNQGIKVKPNEETRLLPGDSFYLADTGCCFRVELE